MPDLDQLLQWLPLALMKPGSPQGAAMMQGFLGSLEHRRRQQIQSQQMAGQEQLRQAQIANLEADNQRAEAQLRLQEDRAALERLSHAVSAFQPAIGQVAETAMDPTQAENQLLQRAGRVESAFGLKPAQLSGFVPPMAPLVSARKKKRAQELYEQAENRFGPEAMAGDSITIQSDLFGPLKPSQLRALFEAPAVEASGQPAVPFTGKKTPPTPGSFEDYMTADPARRGAIESARKRYMQSDDRPVSATPIVIQTAEGPQLLDRGAGTTRPIRAGETGDTLGPAPTSEMRNKAEGRKLAMASIAAVKAYSDRVIRRVGPAQRAEAIHRGADAVFGNDPEFRTYQDARRALAGNLAVAQQGSRPSDADITAIWLPLVPDAYRDTADSAAMKWDLINTMTMPGTSAVPEANTNAADEALRILNQRRQRR